MLRWTAGALALAAAASAAFALWALTPMGPGETALRALESDEVVSVYHADEGWVFSPADDEPRVGFILYPGGRVDARSYAPLAREIASRGYLVVLQPMTLNLAVTSPDRASRAIDAHPEIELWAIGGHSLGGAMAADYAASHPDDIAGLALLAAYPPDNADLSDAAVEAVSVYGTLDGVLDERRFQDATALLPRETRYIAIQGGNHAQFGDYGEQPGDNPATISADDQLYEAADAIVSMLLPLRMRTR